MTGVEAVLLVGELLIIVSIGLLTIQMHECAKAIWAQAAAIHAMTSIPTLMKEETNAGVQTVGKD